MTALLDLVEDEKVAPAMPMRAEVSGSYITLQDNRESANADTVKPPVDVHISKVVAWRTEDGMFHVMGETRCFAGNTFTKSS